MAAIPIRWGARQVALTWVPTTVADLSLAARSATAELVGSLGFVFIAGSLFIVPVATGTELDTLATALGIGLAYAIMMYFALPISGGHINPAVTIGALVARRIPPAMALVYIGAQLSGAVLAGLLMQFVYRDLVGEAAKLAVPAFSGDMEKWTGGFLEAILTFLLVLAVFATALDRRGNRAVAGFAAGLVLTFAFLMAGSLTGAALNPARFFGPAVAAFHWDMMAWYWLGMAGGLVAGLIYEYIFLQGREEEEEPHPGA